MRASIVQQWAGIAASTAGFALFSIPLALIWLGILVILAGIANELNQHRGG